MKYTVVFTGDGSIKFPNLTVITSYILVGAGGSGSHGRGNGTIRARGGAGAGGNIVYGTNMSVSPTVLTITIGSPSANVNDSPPLTNGGSSSIVGDGINIIAGGGMGGSTYINTTGGIGGTGYFGAGSGGNGGANGANGGNGVDGSSYTVGTINSTYAGGGGGGSSNISGGALVAPGGAGGGGYGAVTGTLIAGPGGNNTGGGGGGGTGTQNAIPYPGAVGGSGIVILYF